MTASLGDGASTGAGKRENADVVVVGGGIAGITAAIEIAELGKRVVLIEKQPSIGGRIAGMHQYFPKLCPPACGLEINLRRIKSSPNISVVTLGEVSNVTGGPGNYELKVKLGARYVNERCTACGKCAEVCEIEIDNEYDQGLSKTKAVYLPHLMAYPMRYAVDSRYAADPRMKKCADACEYKAIDLGMKPGELTIKCGSVVWATGWRPYDAAKLENLGFGKFPNVVTNLMMERMASVNGPDNGKILRPSDKKEIGKIGFIQCAGSRDANHLPYCSAVCCMASMKQATYIRSLYPEAEIHVFYIDIRSPGKLEDFYTKMQTDEKIHFHRGKVAAITEDPASRNLILESEDTLKGEIRKTEVELAVLAVGLMPNSLFDKPPKELQLDEYGFIVRDAAAGIVGAGTAVRPLDVSYSVQDATGAAMQAIINGRGRI